MKPVIAVTMGDPAGIGPEICLKAVASGKLIFCNPLVIGTTVVLEKLMRALKLKLELNQVTRPEESVFEPGTLNVLDPGDVRLKKIAFGKVTAECGLASVSYVKTAARLARDSRVDAITTCPINKQAVRMAGLRYSGHTELLSDFFGLKAVMIFVSRKMRVAIVTRHIPVRSISLSITKEKILETILTIYESRGILGLKNPSFAVLSLNPHGGEGGLFGNEEREKIAPAIVEARKLGINVEGPFPSDGFFGSGKHKDFDIIVAMYHDQGLIAYKITSFGKGANVTLGLPIVRTSVDHGTAYDIAGKGIADASPLVEATRIASVMAGRKRKGEKRQVQGTSG